MQIQNLKTKNLALKSPKNVVSLDLDEIDKIFKNHHYPHDMSGIGLQSSLESNNYWNSKSKEKHTKNVNNNNEISHNYAFRYRYNNKSYKSNRTHNNS